MKKKVFLLIILLFCVVSPYICYGEETAEELLDQAYEYFYEHKWDEAQNIYEKIMNLYPNSDEARISHGAYASTFALKFDFERAVVELQKFIDKYPNDEYIPRIEYLLGGSYQDLKKYEEAIIHYEKSLPNLDKNKDEAYYRLGLCYIWSGQYNEAIQSLNKAIQETSNEEIIDSARYQIGWTNRLLNNNDETRNIYTELLNKKSKYVHLDTITVEMGVIYFDDKQYDDAISWFLKALNDYPDMKHKAEVYFWLVRCYYGKDDDDKVMHYLEKAIEVDPQYSPPFNEIAYIYAESNENLDKALVYAQKAVEIDNNNAAYCDTLSWVYYQREQYNDAERSLLPAISLANRDDDVPLLTTIYYHYGMICLKLNRIQLAIANFKKAIQYNGDAESVNKAKEELDKLGETY